MCLEERERQNTARMSLQKQHIIKKMNEQNSRVYPVYKSDVFQFASSI